MGETRPAMPTTLNELGILVLPVAPPLHPDWRLAEAELKSLDEPLSRRTVGEERQRIYAQECRDLLAHSTAPGSRDHGLAHGIERTRFTVPSSVDAHDIPILQLDLTEDKSRDPEKIVVYYHGGGLRVGEDDSEEFSCRRILKSMHCARVYSIGYRLMPTYSARFCVSDALDGFDAIASLTSSLEAKIITIGSSSGGQLAATVPQMRKTSIHGTLLRCPATCDPSEGKKFIPEWLRDYHTSLDPSFESYLLGTLNRTVPRDELGTLPLEATRAELKGHPRTWIQLCTNDILYSDGLCYAMALADAGVDVRVDVRRGWPHTFWLKTPHLDASLHADEAMLEALDWIITETSQLCGDEILSNSTP